MKKPLLTLSKQGLKWLELTVKSSLSLNRHSRIPANALQSPSDLNIKLKLYKRKKPSLFA